MRRFDRYEDIQSNCTHTTAISIESANDSVSIGNFLELNIFYFVIL